MASREEAHLRWAVCEALRAVGPGLFDDVDTFKGHVGARASQQDAATAAALWAADVRALAPLAGAVRMGDASSLAQARYQAYGALCQAGLDQATARAVAGALAGGAADALGVALADMPAGPAAYPQQQAGYSQQQQAYPQQAGYPQQQQPYQQQPYQQQPYPQASYPQPAAPRRRRALPFAIAGGVAALAAVAALVVFVVLPMFQPKGIWLCTGYVTETTSNGETTYLGFECTLDERGRIIKEAHEDMESLTDTGEVFYSADYVYGEDGLCVTEKPNSEDEYASTYAWTRDANGRVVQVTCTEYDGSRSIVSYEYDDKGRIRSRTNDYLSNIGSKSTGRVEFGADGLVTEQFTRSSSSDGEDNSPTHVTCSYKKDLRGRLKSGTTTTIDEDTGTVIYEDASTYEHDSNGNCTCSREHIKQTDDAGKTTESDRAYYYTYTYIEDPDPWVAENARIDVIPLSRAY